MTYATTDQDTKVTSAESATRSHIPEAIDTSAAIDAHVASEYRFPSGSQPHVHSTRYVWYVVLLLAVVNVFNYMDRMALAILLPLIKQDLALSDGQLGLLIGFAFSLFYAICGIPLARWADRGVRRDIIALALTTWSVMTALTGAAQGYWHLFLARVGVGVGEAGCLPPAQSIICDYVPVQRRSGIFAIHNFGLHIGLMLGMLLAGWLGQTIGWRLAFVALGLPGVLLAIVVKLTLREPARGFFDPAPVPGGDGQADKGSVPLRATVAILWKCKTYRWLLLFLITNGFVQFGANQWWPSFCARVFGLDMSSVGVYLGTAIGVGAGGGLLLGGLLANKLAPRNIRSPLWVGVVATLLALPTALASLFVSSATTSIQLIFLTTLLWSISNGPVVAAVYSVVSSRMRAIAGAITIFATSVLGFGLGPLTVGILSDLLAPRYGEESLRYALVVPMCLLPLMAVALGLAAKTLPDDLRHMGVRV